MPDSATKPYRTIVCDPPWQEHGGGKSKRGADRHYSLMDKKKIFQTMRDADCWRPDRSGCHLWLWSTSNFLPDALWLMQVLGFRYVSAAVWVKCKKSTSPTGALEVSLQIGLGQYIRHCHEWLLLGTMGDAMVPRPVHRRRSVIFAKRTTHSTKPVEAYELIESTSPGPRLEMFARGPREKWSVWGNEA